MSSSATSSGPNSQRKKYAVVTGCNRGLGFAMAQRLVREEGFQVAAVCRRLKAARLTAEVLGGPSCAVPIRLDLAAEGEPGVRRVASDITAWLENSSCSSSNVKPKLGLLVNNAGVSYGYWDAEAWRESRAVNYRGPVALTEALLPTLARGGSVLMVGSGLGDVSLLSPEYRQLLTRAQSIAELDGVANRSLDLLGSDSSWVGPYGLSKALLHRAVALLADDPRFTERGLQVDAVCPGWVSTDMGGEQAPISVEEGAGHILDALFKPLREDPSSGSTAGSAATRPLTGTFVCYCHKNYDEEHTRAWEEKHGKVREERGRRAQDADANYYATSEDSEGKTQPGAGRAMEATKRKRHTKKKKKKKRWTGCEDAERGEEGRKRELDGKATSQTTASDAVQAHPAETGRKRRRA